MFKIHIDTTKEDIILNVTENSTGYEYGRELAEKLKPFLATQQNGMIKVYHDDTLIQTLMAKKNREGQVLITENFAGCKPLSFQFKINTEKLPEKYLNYVSSENNHNKFYRMVDLGDGKWGAFYGRIGAVQGEALANHVNVPYTYPDYMYWIKYSEKVAKGYKDRTECHVIKDKEEDTSSKRKAPLEEISDREVRNLIDKLMAYSKHVISENYNIGSEKVTEVMIKEARKEIHKLTMLKTVKAFNKHLLELMSIIPRKMYNVDDFLAKSEQDFDDILQRENDLLDIMEGQVQINDSTNKSDKTKAKTLLDALGLEIYVATDKQVESVKKHLSDSLVPKIKKVFRVINKKTQAAFDEFIKNNPMPNNKKFTVKQLWHGSRNENWMSILQNGLVLNPDAVITGKMFGKGLYFAPSSMKSWNYTSARNTTWAHGNSDTAFMALYAVAYGNPYVVYDHSSSWYNFDYNKLKRLHPDCHSVHAKSDKGMLRADEIMVYNQSQCTINYIVEFAG